MSTNLISIILLMFSFLFLGNYGIHIYYKNKRKLLFAEIGNQKFIEIKNVNAKIYTKSKVSVSWQFFMSDIILIENTLLILLRNYNLKGLINQNQSIIQFTKTVNAKKMNGVGKVYIIEKKEFIENKIQIYSEQNLIVNAKFEILLDFKNRTKESNIVKEYINENLD